VHAKINDKVSFSGMDFIDPIMFNVLKYLLTMKIYIKSPEK
jgi:hypothetical protein